jgi:long-chain fatty acid transport protein
MISRQTRLAATSVLAGGAVLLCLSTSLPARAGAFYIQEQSTRGAGRAYSGEAADTGPESLWWNPAAIASSPMEAFGSISGIFPSGKVVDQGSTLTLPVPPAGETVPVGGNPVRHDPIFNAPVAAGGFAMPIGDRFAAGVSLTTPFDLETKYPADSFARYEALKSRLDTVDVQLTGAVKAASWIDLGAGVDAVYTSARLSNASPNLVAGAPDGKQDLTGDGWNWGWVVGTQIHPDSNWNIGLSYRSSVRRDLHGDVVVSGLLGPLAAANVVTHGDAHFKTPWIATFGVHYHMNPQVTLNAQVQRLGWSEFKAIDVSFPGVSQTFPQNYNDETSAAFGFDVAMSQALTLRAGVQWDPTPTPDQGRTLRVPDSDRWLIGGGGDFRLGKHLTLEGAVDYVDFQGSHVDSSAVFYPGTQAETIADYSAKVGANAWVVSGGLRYQF